MRNMKFNDLIVFKNFTKVMVKLSADTWEKWFNVQRFHNRMHLEQLVKSNNPIIYFHNSDDGGGNIHD